METDVRLHASWQLQKRGVLARVWVLVLVLALVLVLVLVFVTY